MACADLPPDDGLSLLVTGALVVTLDATDRVLDRGSIAMRNGEIEAIFPSTPEADREASARYTPNRVVAADGRIALPGLVNCHTHASEILLRGAGGADRSLYDWQWNVVYPASLQYQPRDVYVASLLYAIDSLRAGTTTFVDNSNSARSLPLAEAAIAAYHHARVRAVLAPIFAVGPLPDDKLLPLGEHVQGSVVRVPPKAMLLDLDVTRDMMDTLMTARPQWGDDRVSVWPAPHKPNRTSVESIQMAHDLVRRHGGMVSQPCAEVAAESKVGDMTAVAHLAAIGGLTPRTLLGHCVHVSEADIASIARSGATLAHLPVANLYLGSGIAPLPAMKTAGVTVGLGTDNANCNDTVSILREATFAALIQKGVSQDAETIRALDVLRMATSDGARAIRRGHDLGSLEVGKRADLILLNTARANLTPLHDPVSALIYQAYGSEVDTTIIGGELVLQRGVLTFMSLDEEQALRDEAQRLSTDLLRRITHS